MKQKQQITFKEKTLIKHKYCSCSQAYRNTTQSTYHIKIKFLTEKKNYIKVISTIQILFYFKLIKVKSQYIT